MRPVISDYASELLESVELQFGLGGRIEHRRRSIRLRVVEHPLPENYEARMLFPELMLDWFPNGSRWKLFKMSDYSWFNPSQATIINRFAGFELIKFGGGAAAAVLFEYSENPEQ